MGDLESTDAAPLTAPEKCRLASSRIKEKYGNLAALDYEAAVMNYVTQGKEPEKLDGFMSVAWPHTKAMIDEQKAIDKELKECADRGNEDDRAPETFQFLDSNGREEDRETVKCDQEFDDHAHENLHSRSDSTSKHSTEALEAEWLDEEHRQLGLKLAKRLKEDERLLALIVEHTRHSEEDWLEHASEVGVEADSLLGLCLFDEWYELTPRWVYEERRIPHTEGHETYWSYVAAMTRYYEQFLEWEKQQGESDS